MSKLACLSDNHANNHVQARLEIGQMYDFKCIQKMLIITAVMLFSVLFNLQVSQASTSAPTQQTIADSYFQQADMLFTHGKFNEAYDVYSRLFRENPNNDKITLALAVSATRIQKWNQALMAYEILLEKYPNDTDLLLELVNLYMLLGDKGLAEMTLAKAQSLGANRLNQASIGKLETRYDTLQTNGNVRFGLAFDSNVNMGPASENIQLGNWQVSIPGSSRIASPGAYAAANLDFAWKKWRDSKWWIVSTGNLYFRSFFNSDLAGQNIQDSQWAKVNLGTRYMGVRNLLDMRIKVDIFAYELDQNVLSVGPEITYYYLANPTDSLYTVLSIDYQKNSDSLDMTLSSNSSTAHADGWYGKLTQHWRHIITKDLNFTAGLGVLFGNATSNRYPQYDYIGAEALFNMEYTTPIEIVLIPSISAATKAYAGIPTILETKKRQDTTLRAGLSGRYDINEDWQVDVVYGYTHNFSTSGLYKYNQHAVSTGVTMKF